MLLPQYNAYGVNHYLPIINAIKNKNGSNYKNAHLVPNIVNMKQTIESRSKIMADTVEKKMKDLKVDHCHLAAYSFAGIDARALISL